MKAKLVLVLGVMIFLTACVHTVQGMKEDIREDTASPSTKPTVVKKTTVVYPDQSSPSSLPPLQTPQ